METYFVCPVGDVREVARRVAIGADFIAAFVAKDGTDGVQGLWRDVGLGDGGDDLMT